MQTPLLWCHGTADLTVLFEAGQAGPPLLEPAGVSCEFKVNKLLEYSIVVAFRVNYIISPHILMLIHPQ